LILSLLLVLFFGNQPWTPRRTEITCSDDRD
jgi:hypothetical protein